MDKNLVSFEFPEVIRSLPLADVPIDGCIAHMVQCEKQQILFMQFEREIEVAEHFHNAQWGIVLAGSIRLTIEGETREFTTGDSYYIKSGEKHNAYISAGYADITYFDQPNRYRMKT